MRILTLSFILIAAFVSNINGQTSTETAYLKDLEKVVEINDEPMQYEKDGVVWLEVKKGKKADQIEVTHITGEGSYSTRLYYLTPEGIIINGKRSTFALPDGEWIYFENNKPVMKRWFVKGEMVREKNL